MGARKKPHKDDLVGQLQALPEQIVRLLSRIVDLEDRVLIRLERRIREEGRHWTPSERFTGMVTSLGSSASRLSAEIRAINKEREAIALSDTELRVALSEAASHELDHMSDAEFAKLARRRAIAAGIDVGGDEAH